MCVFCRFRFHKSPMTPRNEQLMCAVRFGQRKANENVLDQEKKKKSFICRHQACSGVLVHIKSVQLLKMIISFIIFLLSSAGWHNAPATRQCGERGSLGRQGRIRQITRCVRTEHHYQSQSLFSVLLIRPGTLLQHRRLIRISQTARQENEERRERVFTLCAQCRLCISKHNFSDKLRAHCWGKLSARKSLELLSDLSKNHQNLMEFKTQILQTKRLNQISHVYILIFRNEKLSA